MRWRRGRRSDNIEDRRGRGRRAVGGFKLSGWMIVAVLVFSVLTGKNPLALLQQLGGSGALSGGGGGQTTPVAQRSAAEQEMAEFVAYILGSTEEVWSQEFAKRGTRYRKPPLVLFDNMVQSRCGINSAATGPFYCPGDQKVYLSLGFFNQLKQLGAPGDFARAYVIGHEIGHHVQNLTGSERKVRQMQSQARSRAEANRYSVMQELQADCLAGVWAHHSNKKYHWMEPGDVEEGLRAAASIGDDRLQKRAGKRVNEEAFTHGTSEQRAYWLKRGMRSGRLEDCDTYSAGI